MKRGPLNNTNKFDWYPGIILAMVSANEVRRYNVTPSLIDGAHTKNGLCVHHPNKT